MSKQVLAWLALATLAPAAAAQTSQRDRLREAVQLPRITVYMVSWAFYQTKGGLCLRATDNARAEIAALRHSLVGDGSDADRYDRLAELYDEVKDEVHARQAREWVVVLLRHRLEVHPDDALAMSDLGQTLMDLERFEEGEALVRRAVQARPREAQCWMALGDALVPLAMRELLDKGEKLPVYDDFERLAGWLLEKRLSPQQIIHCVARVDEAKACMDRAVALAPDQAESYLRRARAVDDGWVLLRATLRYRQGAEPADIRRESTTGTFLRDVSKAAQLSPRQYIVQVWAVMQAFRYAEAHGSPPIPGWRGHAAARQVIEEAVGRLERLAQTEDRELASTSCESLAWLYVFVFEDPEHAEKYLRRAIALKPTHEQMWDLLVGALGGSGRNQEALAAGLEQLKHKDSARNRLLVAKAYESLNLLSKAQEQVQAALQIEPKDFLATVGKAALLLKQADNAGALAEAGVVLGRAEKLLAKDAPRDERLDYIAILGVYMGLTGDRAEARRLLRQVLEQDGNHRMAAAAIRALGE
jgi:tetratricopeptide (TPR) repeat protein